MKEDDPVLIISGGGRRGLSALGFLCENSNKLPPIRHYAGVSTGAILSAFLAAGLTAREILNLYKSIDKAKCFKTLSVKHLISHYGLLVPKNLYKTLYNELYLLGYKTPRDYKGRLSIFATRLETGDSINLCTEYPDNDIAELLLASSAIPGFLPPVHIGGYNYIDGAFSDNCPTIHFAHCKSVTIIDIGWMPRSIYIPDDVSKMTLMYLLDNLRRCMSRKPIISKQWSYYICTRRSENNLCFPETPDQINDLVLNHDIRLFESEK